MHSLLVWAGMALFIATNACAQSAPPGWAQRSAQNGTLYTPPQLPAGRVLHAWMSAPFDLRDGANALQQQSQADAREAPALAGRRPQCELAKPAANGVLMQACRFDVDAVDPVYVQYVLLPAVVGRSIIVRMAMPDDEPLVQQHQAGLGHVLREAMRMLTGDGVGAPPLATNRN